MHLPNRHCVKLNLKLANAQAPHAMLPHKRNPTCRVLMRHGATVYVFGSVVHKL